MRLFPPCSFCMGNVPHDLEIHIPLHLSLDTVHCFSNRLRVIPFLTLLHYGFLSNGDPEEYILLKDLKDFLLLLGSF